MSSYTRQQLEKWLSEKKVSGKVLDVGGAQNPAKGRIQSAEDTRFAILDLDIPHELKQNPDIIHDLNEETIHEDYLYLFDSFDFVVCGEVTEYFWNPLHAIKTIGRFLKKGGTLFISFHFIYPVHNPVEADMTRYTRNGAIKMLREAGFEIKEITPRKGTDGATQVFFMREQMRPAKGYQFHNEVGILVEAIKK